MKRHKLQAIAMLVALSAQAACASLTQTPPGFVELEDAGWDYRATSAEGVVITVRHLAHEPEGELSFWTRSVEQEMAARGGYALVDERPVQTSAGAPGALLRFRHQAADTPHLYFVALFIDEDTFGSDDLFVVEAGGTEEAVVDAEGAILRAIEGLRVD